MKNNPLFVPELGQAVYGQPTQQYHLDLNEELLLGIMRDLWDILRDSDNPFSNTGGRIENDKMQIEAYCWDEDHEQYWNLRWGTWRVSWYKHCSRSASVNRRLEKHEYKLIIKDYLELLEVI